MEYEKNSKKPNPEAQRSIRVLNLMTIDELKQLYSTLGLTPNLSPEAPKDFLVKKISEKAGEDVLLNNKMFAIKILDQHNRIISSLEKILDGLTRETLVNIFKEIKNEEIEKDKTKREIIQKILIDVPFEKVWQSKTLHKNLALKRSSKADLRKIKSQIVEVGEAIKDTKEEYIKSHSGVLNEINQKIKKSTEDLEEIKLALRSPEGPSLSSLLQAIYEQAIEIDGQLSAKIVDNQEKYLLEKFKINEKELTFKSLEALALYSLLQNVKNLMWLPSSQAFNKVVEHELMKIKGAGDKAEIPKLRKLVCHRLGMTDEAFDSMLTQAWDEGFVELETGAPIGRSEVKYLITKSGSTFFYVKLKRGL